MASVTLESGVLFISHNAADRPFAIALNTAIRELVGDKIDVRFSTSDEAGPQGGEAWRKWIDRQVVEAHTALIIVTPHAVGKPWLLWEAGACSGAALAQKALGAATARLNVSIAYGLTENECPDPLRGDQIILGIKRDRMKQLLYQILDTHNISSDLQRTAGEHMQEILDRYIAAVNIALLQAPSLVTEANVQDWLSRLDKLAQSGRFSELDTFQRWMALAFGREGEVARVPIDVRLHRRLCELYLSRAEFGRAVEQLNLARWAAPPDVFVLRPLVEASIKRLLASPANEQDESAREETKALLTAILDLDPDAFVAAPDAAALYGKFLRRVTRNPEQAAEVYAAALRANSNSYYLADLLAQTQLELGRKDAAKTTYGDTLAIIDRLGERSLWSRSTAANAYLDLGDIDGARRHLVAIAALPEKPRLSEIDVICGGLREIARNWGIARSVSDELMALITTATARA